MSETRRSNRNKHPSDKIAQLQQEKAEEAKIQAETRKRREDRTKRNRHEQDRAAGIPLTEDPTAEREDTMITFRPVASKPKTTKHLAQRASKIPPSPLHPESTPHPRRQSQSHSSQARMPSPTVQNSHHLSQARTPSPTVQNPHHLSQARTPSPRVQSSCSPEPSDPHLHSRFDSPDPYSPVHSTSVAHSPSDRCPSPGQPRPPPSIEGSPEPRGSSRSQSPSADPPQSRSPSPAPLAGTKWKQTFDNPLNDLFSKAPRTKRGRPKASDYTEVEQDVIALTNGLYRCLISTEDAFPDTPAELSMIKHCWEVALNMRALNAIPLAPGIFRVIRARGPQIRGEAKSKMVLLVAAIYGFNSGRSKKAVIANRHLAESLKHEKGFVFKVLGDDNTSRKGVYQNPIIREGVNVMWFKNKQDEGIEFSDLFDPLPVEAIAFIECAIDEWATGLKTDIPFQTKEYMSVYRDHLESLHAYGEYTAKHGLLEKMCQKLYNDGRIHAGVLPKTAERRPAIPYSVFKAAIAEHEEMPEGASEDEEDIVM